MKQLTYVIISLIIPTIIGFVIPQSNQMNAFETKGNPNLNIQLVERDATIADAKLFKKLFFSTQLFNQFSYTVDGDENQQNDQDCYDDTLPTRIYIHKGGVHRSPKEFVDYIRSLDSQQDVRDSSFAICQEQDLFNTENYNDNADISATIQSLQKKVLKSSFEQFLDENNDLIYVVNGTQWNRS